MLVLALDPGVTTGYAVGEIYGRWTEGNGMFNFIYCGEDKLDELGLWNMLCSISPTFLIAESFEFRQNTRDNVVLFSRNLLGVSALWAGMAHRDFRTQSASEGKGFYSDKKLRSLSVYSPGKVHARDATRHLLYFMGFKGGSKYLSREQRITLCGIE